LTIQTDARNVDRWLSPDWIQAVGSIATAVGLTVAGIWAYVKTRKRREFSPHVTGKNTIEFVGRHNGDWLVVLILELANTGPVRFVATDFTYELRCAFPGDDLDQNDAYGIELPTVVDSGSWLGDFETLLVEPNSRDTFKHVTLAPGTASLLQLYTEFTSAHGKQLDDIGNDVIVVIPPVDPSLALSDVEL
jgi:hypothetical protein